MFEVKWAFGWLAALMLLFFLDLTTGAFSRLLNHPSPGAGFIFGLAIGAIMMGPILWKLCARR